MSFVMISRAFSQQCSGLFCQSELVSCFSWGRSC